MPLPDSAQFTVGETATIIRGSVFKVQRLCERGVLVAVRTKGGHRRVTGESIKAYLASGLVKDVAS